MKTGMNAKKLEYFLDIFKGTCEINNYKECFLTSSKNDNIVEHVTDALKEEKGKFYFYGSADKSDNISMGVVLKGFTDNFRMAELINLAVKTFQNAGFYESTVLINTPSTELIELLEDADLVVDKNSLNKDKEQDMVFELDIEDRTVVHGEQKGDTAYFIINYEAIEELIEHDEKNTLDAAILPKSKEVLEDAFLIATNLKDAGFKIEVDYDLNGKVSEDADFLISLDTEDIQKYQVKLKDTKTNEEREIMIDNLVEELSFI